MFDPTVTLSYDKERELTQAVLDGCSGRWDQILPRVVPSIQEAIDKGHRRHVDCIFPASHGPGGGKEKFRITQTFPWSGAVICTCTARDKIRGGLDVVMRALSVDFKTARNLLACELGITLAGEAILSPTLPPAPPKREVDDEAIKAESTRIKASIARIWNETVELSHPSAEPGLLWFEHRGVTPLRRPFQDIRFHQGLKYYEGDEYVGTFPCIVSMIRTNAGFSRTIHRTFITANGRKPTEIRSGKTRKLYTVPKNLTASGAAVRIDEPTSVLNLAEGIETALSARLLTRLPTWACISKDMLRAVEIPECVRIVTVWADKDRSDAGQEAAAELVLALRARGIKAVAMLPPGDIPEGAKSLDWNDLVMQRGVDALRRDFQFRIWQRELQNMLGDSSTSNAVAARAFD